ncbi:MAG: DUF3576 domain-containing protein [Holosporales bacterium]|jgi:hypothetical protein|nr:DUF3576 domain-containing protein [Holosporales bacterium]
MFKNQYFWIYFLCLGGCTSVKIEDVPKASIDKNKSNYGSVLGNSSLVLNKNKPNQKYFITRGDFGINKFLWEGAIETIGFMPILTADPRKGKIITDWYKKRWAAFLGHTLSF